MPLLISGIRLTPDQDRSNLEEVVPRLLQVSPDRVRSLRIVKRSIDARHDVRILYQIEITANDEDGLFLQLQEKGGLTVLRTLPVSSPFAVRKKIFRRRPVVVGFGPAGIFASLLLARAGAAPIVLERGRPVPERVKDVETFWAGGSFRDESNVCFGEGGAGTFSDGKLTTGKRGEAIPWLLSEFVEAGAPPEILYDAKPHIGTDRLRAVIVALRRKIESLGGEIRFASKVSEIIVRNGRIEGVRIHPNEEINTDLLIVATGHGAGDTYEALFKGGAGMEPKPLAIGVRIEHPQVVIDRAQYGRWAGHVHLGAADYRLTYRDQRRERGVYSFCMCPGGKVIAANSQTGRIVTNGMSLFRRDSGYANSGLVVTVRPEDFGRREPLAGLTYLAVVEQKAFHEGGENYYAPAQRVTDFLQKKTSISLPEVTYRPGVVSRDLHEVLPTFVTAGLREALPRWGRKIPGFVSQEGVLVGVETRTSSPVRILRGKDYASTTVKGLYPVGEGAGHAGGIVSSALDGLYCVASILDAKGVESRERPPQTKR